MSKDHQVIIIGGGISGLITAYELIKSGIRPLLIERETFLGGMASCHRIGDFWIEKFYHHFFTHDTHVMRVVRELDLEKSLVWNESKVALFANGKLHNFSTPLDLIMFSELGFSERIRFGLFTMMAAKNSDVEALDGLKAKDWLQDTIGFSAFSKVVSPLMQSKFGVRMDDISAAFMAGRIRARANSRGRFYSSEKLGYLKGGLCGFTESLLKRLLEMGCDVRMNCEINRIVIKGNSGFELRTSEGMPLECQNLVVTTPTPVLGDMLCHYPEVSAMLKGFAYRSAVCLCVGIAGRLSDYYWINIASGDLPFGVIVEHTNLVSASDYNDSGIVYVSRYDDVSSELFMMSDEEVLELYLDGIMRMFPGFRKSRIKWWQVSREPFATPVYSVHYKATMAHLRSKLPRGLHVTGNSTIYPDSRNINNIIRSASEAVKKIAADCEL